MITGDTPIKRKTALAETYEESLIETIKFLVEIKKKKHQVLTLIVNKFNIKKISLNNLREVHCWI